MKKISVIFPLLMGAAMVMPAQAQQMEKTLQYQGAAQIRQADAAGEWKSLGTGVFRENFMTAFYTTGCLEYNVEVEESLETPGRYRIVNPYATYPDITGAGEVLGSTCLPGDHYIYVNASDPKHVHLERSRTGFYLGQVYDEEGIWGDPGKTYSTELIVSSMAYEEFVKNGDWEQADKEKLCGKIEHGSITFPANRLLAGSMIPEVSYDLQELLYKMTDSQASFYLRLPGAPELRTSMSLVGISDDKSELIFNVQLGKDAQKAKVALVRGEYYDEITDGILDGSISSVEITTAGEVRIPYTNDGIHTLVVIPFYNDEPASTVTRQMELAYSEDEWRKVGKALYREGILSSNEMNSQGIPMKEYEYQVEVEENVERPGYIRMVDAYGDAFPGGSGYSYDDSRRWYIYIDATNPDEVMIEYARQGIGLNLGYGRMQIWCNAQRFMEEKNQTKDQVRKYFGTFANNEITFPKDALCIVYQPAPNTWYWANEKGNFRLKFEPGQLRGEQSGVSDVAVDDSDVPVEYYTIDGLRVNVDQLRSGVYVVRQGSKTYKKVVR